MAYLVVNRDGGPIDADDERLGESERRIALREIERASEQSMGGQIVKNP